MRGGHLLDENRFCASNVVDCLTRNGFGQKSNEIARMAGLERDTDFAIGLEASNSGTVPGTWIDNDEGPQLWIDFDARGRNYPHQHIVDRTLQCASIDDQFGLVIEHVRRRFGHVLAILVPALTHDIPEQDAALERIYRVAYGRRENARRGRARLRWRKVCLRWRHCFVPSLLPLARVHSSRQ